MNKPTDSVSDQKLEQLYQQRKREHKLPADVKQALLSEAIKEHKFNQTSLFNMALGLACTLFVGLFFWFSIQSKPYDNYQIENLIQAGTAIPVEVHSITQSKDYIEDSMRIAENVYLQPIADELKRTKQVISEGKQLLEEKRVLYATLSSADRQWEILTCDDKKIRLDESLVKRLTENKKRPIELNAGDYIMLTRNTQGQIIMVSKTSQQQRCVLVES